MLATISAFSHLLSTIVHYGCARGPERKRVLHSLPKKPSISVSLSVCEGDSLALLRAWLVLLLP